MLEFVLFAMTTLASSEPAMPSEPTRLVLDWEAPATCPRLPELLAWVDALMADALVPAIEASASIVVQTTTTHGYTARMHLQVGDRREDRSLDGPDCTVVAHAAAVVVAASLDSIAVAQHPTVDVPESPRVEPAESPRTPPRPPMPQTHPDDPRPAPSGMDESQPRRLMAGVRLGTVLGAGVVPSVGVGLRTEPFVGGPRLHVRAVAQYWARRRIPLDPRRDVAGELRLAVGGARICPRWTRGSVHVALCGGIDAGAVHGRGVGEELIDARSAAAPWAAAVLEPNVELTITPALSLWIALEGVVALYRPRFAIDGAAGQWTAGAGALRGVVGVSVHRPMKKP